MKFNITEKRAIFISLAIFIAILVYEISNKYGLAQKVIKTNATPITNKVVVLDARAPAFLMRGR